MLTIEEYIGKMKRANKIDEFDYSKQSENMTAVMKYVMSYFNEYLTMEICDAEGIKLKQTVDKLEKEISNKYPESKDFILDFYLKHKFRIYRAVDNWLSELPCFDFYFSDQDFSSLADSFCTSYKLKDVDLNQYNKDIARLMAEIKKYITEPPSVSEMIRLDNNLVSWVRETYRQYGVNLYTFASNLAYTYYERYVKYERNEWTDRRYRINNYNHRYNDNPFDIERIYDENKFRTFLENKRGELEMLVMHEWLFNEVYDDDYWPEYVNLCVARGRVSIVKNVNALLPVSSNNLNYPEDIVCSTEHIITTDGVLKNPPKEEYILRVNSTQENSTVWQNIKEMTTLIEKIDTSIINYGPPKILEFTSPLKTASFDEEIFFSCCSLLEKKMKKYSHMKIAIVNGSGNQRTKPVSYISTIEDIIKLKDQLRQRKIRLQFSIDFPLLFASKRDTNYNQSEIFGALIEYKNSIVCLNITNVTPKTRNWPKSKTMSDGTDVFYLNKYRYPIYDDFYSMLSVTFNDNQRRYLIPKNIANDDELEVLVDNLLRSGFGFCSGGNSNE